MFELFSISFLTMWYRAVISVETKAWHYIKNILRLCYSISLQHYLTLIFHLIIEECVTLFRIKFKVKHTEEVLPLLLKWGIDLEMTQCRLYVLSFFSYAYIVCNYSKLTMYIDKLFGYFVPRDDLNFRSTTSFAIERCYYEWNINLLL